MWDFFDRLNLWINRGLMALGGVAALALMGVAVSNVALRAAGRPFSGAYEMVGFLGAVVVAFALGATQRRKDHVMVDVFTRKLPAPVLRAIDGLNYLLNLVFFAFLAWHLAKWGFSLRRSGELSETLRIPFHPFVWLTSLGLAALVFTLFVDLLALFRRQRPRGGASC